MKPYAPTRSIASGRTRLSMQVEGVEGRGLAAALVGDAILSVAVPEAQSLSQAWFVQARLGSGRSLELSGSSTEVGNWVEYGTVNVGLRPCPEIIAVPLSEVPVEAFVIASVQMLVVDLGAFQVEAGLVITGQGGFEVVIVAVDVPGALAVRLPGGQGFLDAPFSCGDYRRMPV